MIKTPLDKIVLCIFSFIILLSINLNFYNLENPFDGIASFKSKIKFIRSTLPLFLIFVCLLLLYKIKFIHKKKLENNYYFKIYLTYIFFQLVGFYFSDFNKYQNLFYLYLLFSSLVFFYYLYQFELKIIKQIYYLFFSLFLIIFFIFFLNYFILYLANDNINFYTQFPDVYFNPYLYENLQLPINPSEFKECIDCKDTIYKTSILGEIPPRSSGLSRIAVILTIFLSLYLIFKKKFKILLFALIIFINFSIFLMQSRISIYFLAIFYIFLKIYFVEFKLKHILTFLIFPFVLFVSCETFFKKKNYFNILQIFKHEKLKVEINNNNIKSDSLRLLNSTSTGRLDIWKNIINNTKDRWIIGNGPQADRMIKKTKREANEVAVGKQSASSAIIYTYASSGILGVILLFYFYFRISKTIFKNLFVKINTQRNYLKIISIFVIIYLLLRSLVESSIAVTGIDYILISLNVVLLNKIEKKHI